jgi:hypothetical protein
VRQRHAVERAERLAGSAACVGRLGLGQRLLAIDDEKGAVRPSRCVVSSALEKRVASRPAAISATPSS